MREAAAEADVENKINLFLNTETGQKIIEDKIDQISASPEGQLVESMDINVGYVCDRCGKSWPLQEKPLFCSARLFVN